MNRWENSDYYARTFSPLLQSAIPRIRRFDFTVAQMTSIFTTQQILFPALNGFAVIPIYQTLIRTGAPYATQPGSIRNAWLDSTNTFIATMGSWTSAIGLLTAAGTRNAYTLYGWNGINAGQVNQLNMPMDDGITGYGSKSVALGAASNPTVTAALPGSPVTLIFCYYLIATYPESAGGPITPFLT